MAEAAFWGLVGASALIVGAEVAFGFKLSRMTIGLIMAFGVGALISAVSFELVAPAIETAEVWQVAVGLGLGSATFFIGDRLIAKTGGSYRKSKDGESDDDSGLGIVLGTVLDGIPESAVLGMSLATTGRPQVMNNNPAVIPTRRPNIRAASTAIRTKKTPARIQKESRGT